MTKISLELGQKMSQVFNCNVQFAKKARQKPKLEASMCMDIIKRGPF